MLCFAVISTLWRVQKIQIRLRIGFISFATVRVTTATGFSPRRCWTAHGIHLPGAKFVIHRYNFRLKRHQQHITHAVPSEMLAAVSWPPRASTGIVLYKRLNKPAVCASVLPLARTDPSGQIRSLPPVLGLTTTTVRLRTRSSQS